MMEFKAGQGGYDAGGGGQPNNMYNYKYSFSNNACKIKPSFLKAGSANCLTDLLITWSQTLQHQFLIISCAI